jgi:hypothetical protein
MWIKILLLFPIQYAVHYSHIFWRLFSQKGDQLAMYITYSQELGDYKDFFVSNDLEIITPMKNSKLKIKNFKHAVVGDLLNVSVYMRWEF